MNRDKEFNAIFNNLFIIPSDFPLLFDKHSKLMIVFQFIFFSFTTNDVCKGGNNFNSYHCSQHLKEYF